jgi:polyribonucleotide nucleotidyltransferase
VKVVSIDKTGKIRLSRKEAMAERAAAQQGTADAAAAAQPAAEATQPGAKA